MRKTKSLTGLIIGALTLLGAGTAVAGPVEFSADAKITQPGAGAQTGTLYVSERGMRLEAEHNGRKIVEIRLPKEQVNRILFPDDKTYVEMPLPPGMTAGATQKDKPCETSEMIACEQGDDEELDGAKLQTWTVKPTGAPSGIKVWWDATRKMPIRQMFPDGRSIQATMKGSETFADRSVERWEISFQMPGAPAQTGTILHDPEYGLNVFEGLPGGMQRELRNVKMGAPDAALFEVPEGYTMMGQPPQDAQQMQQPQPQQVQPQQMQHPQMQRPQQPYPYGGSAGYPAPQPQAYGQPYPAPYPRQPYPAQPYPPQPYPGQPYPAPYGAAPGQPPR
ncbi:MAG: hypothetical protein C0606_14095 [Hyphomicrobiales bacterium]|nr:MAG: hypothetical protein C0606_14095 [Hyphomicrobiales bacterium]